MESPRVKWIESKLSGKMILDVGFSGEEEPFLHRKILKKNPESLLVGIDVNKEAVLAYQLKDTIVGDAFDLPFKNKTFEYCILAEVLEHLYHPYKMFQEIYRVLKGNGKIILTTPNSYDLFRWLRFWLFPKKVFTRKNYRKYLGAHSHLMFWDPLSLCNMLYDHGFEVKEIVTKNIGIPILRRFFPQFNKLNIPIYPFNRIGGYICLVAIKDK
jgi:SAM-dependent methyltransferase